MASEAADLGRRHIPDLLLGYVKEVKYPVVAYNSKSAIFLIECYSFYSVVYFDFSEALDGLEILAHHFEEGKPNKSFNQKKILQRYLPWLFVFAIGGRLDIRW